MNNEMNSSSQLEECVELLVNKPSIRMYILMLDTRNVDGVEFLMKQTKMYVCTLKNIYSSRCSHIAVHG